MSGENFDPPWRAGRDLYSDVWMVGRQAWFIERMTRRFADRPAVTGWLVSNEMPIYGEPATREVVSSWARLMVQAIRAGGGHQPVSIGDGAWGAEVTGQDNRFSFSVLRQAYVSAKLVDLPVGLTRGRDDLDEDCSLYLLPSTKQLTAPSCYRLEHLARQGATVYVSYCHGTSSFQRGPWFAHLNEMFGIEHQLRYGLVDRITHAEVIAVDQDGRPALLRRRVGDGWIVLCTYPLEHMADLVPGVNPDDTVRLYDALAVTAGVHRPVVVDDPAVSTETLGHRDGHRFAFLISHSDDPVTVKPRVREGGLVEPHTSRKLETLELAPHEVSILRLNG